MAKQDFPGLVLVPPSDRQIVRRRLARWTLLIVAVIGGISALNIWLPSPNQTTNCQPGSDVAASPDSHEGCGQPDQSFTEAQSLPNDFTVAKASEGTGPAISHSPIPTPAPPPNASRPAAPHTTKQPSPANPPKPVITPEVRTAAAPRAEQPTTTRTAEKPTPNLNSSLNSSLNSNPSPNPSPDTHLAEQGDAFAQYRLGRFYAQHGGPEAPESVSWYMKASNGLRRLAKTGNGEAMYVLGVMYAFGRGVQKDTEEARRWLTQAVEHQIPAARPLLASLERHRIAQSDRTNQGG